MTDIRQTLEGRLSTYTKLDGHLSILQDDIQKGISDFESFYITAKKDIENTCSQLIDKVKKLENQLLTVLTDGYNLQKERMNAKVEEREKLHLAVKQKQSEMQKCLSAPEDAQNTGADSGVPGNNCNEWIESVKKLHKSIKCFKIRFRPKALHSLKSVSEIGEVLTEELPFIKKLPEFNITDDKASSQRNKPLAKIKPGTQEEDTNTKAPPPRRKLKQVEENEEPNPKARNPRRVGTLLEETAEGPVMELPEKEWSGTIDPAGELPMVHLYKDDTILVIIGTPHKLMLYSKKGEVLKEVKTTTWPIDLCVFDEKIALCLYNENKITIHDADSFEQISEFDVGVRPYSVCRLDGLFIVSFPRERLVRKYNEEGGVVKVSDKLFRRPTFVVSHPTKSIFLVSDSMKNGIFCLNAELKTIWTFIEPSLKDPRSMCYVENGILVCGVWSDNIVLVSERGKYLRTVLTKENCGISKPRTICDNSNNDTYVVSEDGGKIKIFLKEDILPLG